MSSLALLESFATSVGAFNLPDPSPTMPPGLESPLGQVFGWIKGGAIATGVIVLSIVGIKMIAGIRGRSNSAVDGATHIPWAFGGLGLVLVAGGVITTLAGI